MREARAFTSSTDTSVLYRIPGRHRDTTRGQAEKGILVVTTSGDYRCTVVEMKMFRYKIAGANIRNTKKVYT